MTLTANRLVPDHVGKHITLIDPGGSVSGTLKAFTNEVDPAETKLQPVDVLVEIFGTDYELHVSPYTECEISD